MTSIKEVSSNKVFGGYQKVFSHLSLEVNCEMKFSVFLPPKVEDGTKAPVLYYLSGLTCTEQNFITKGGAQKYAAEKGLIIVGPDTSPRGCNIEGEDDSYDFGSGAGFYVDATVDKWKKNYRMYSYVTKELPEIINANFPVIPDKASIFGHSMGGHGALTIFLKNPGKYRSVSAFAPICNPTQVSWGIKCLGGYLGDNKELWKVYDATELAKTYKGPPTEILIDVGKADEFINNLKPERLVASCAESKTPIVLRLQEGYDHSYYFISSFMEDHINHHAKYLNA